MKKLKTVFLVLFLISFGGNSFANNEWFFIAASQDQDFYMSFNHMNILKAYGNQQPTQIEAWVKPIIVYDIVKDGMTVGDYSLVRGIFNCIDKTSNVLEIINYKKDGRVIN